MARAEACAHGSRDCDREPSARWLAGDDDRIGTARGGDVDQCGGRPRRHSNADGPRAAGSSPQDRRRPPCSGCVPATIPRRSVEAAMLDASSSTSIAVFSADAYGIQRKGLSDCRSRGISRPVRPGSSCCGLAPQSATRALSLWASSAPATRRTWRSSSASRRSPRRRSSNSVRCDAATVVSGG